MAKISAAAAPSKEILEAALTGLEAQREKIDQQIAQVRIMLGGMSKVGRVGKSSFPYPAHSSTLAVVPRKRVLSPEARKRIAAAQKKRWAAFRKAQS